MLGGEAGASPIPSDEHPIPNDLPLGIGGEPPPPGSEPDKFLTDGTSPDTEKDLQGTMQADESVLSGTDILTTEKVAPNGTIISLNPGPSTPPPPVVTQQLNDSVSPDAEQALGNLLK
jgi:hypothetical protein